METVFVKVLHQQQVCQILKPGLDIYPTTVAGIIQQVIQVECHGNKQDTGFIG